MGRADHSEPLEGQRQIVEAARLTSVEAWEKPSQNAGWTCNDLLAHLATGDWVFRRR